MITYKKIVMVWEKLKKLLCREPDESFPSDGKKILVIDDGESERRFMTQSLGKAGYAVIAKSDGMSGLEAALAMAPDLVILDYLMPEMDGTVVCRKLKSNPQTKNIPIIFLTGSSRPETVIRCYDIGADQYLTKPISARQLLKQVRATLDEIPSPG